MSVKDSKKSVTLPAGNIPGKITVVVAEDHNIVREGLLLLLGGAPDIAVLGNVENGRQALRMVEALHPDVVILDVVMEKLNGLEATRQICQRAPKTKVLILSSFNDPERVEQLLQAGATSYLEKRAAAKELLNAIRETSKGNTVFSPSISERLREKSRAEPQRRPEPKPKLEELTTREVEVLQLIAEGYVNKAIAAEMCLSIKTIEKHRQQVMNKLRIHNIAGLTRHAVEMGIVDSGRADLNGET
jgi:DNA-binding NarL/FixJ family response regulator